MSALMLADTLAILSALLLCAALGTLSWRELRPLNERLKRARRIAKYDSCVVFGKGDAPWPN